MKNADKPAMPCTKEETKWNRGGGRAFSETVKVEEFGLTKREMFAMHALSSVLDMYNPYEDGSFDSSNYEQTAKHAVGLADALLAELDK